MLFVPTKRNETHLQPVSAEKTCHPVLQSKSGFTNSFGLLAVDLINL